MLDKPPCQLQKLQHEPYPQSQQLAGNLGLLAVDIGLLLSAVVCHFGPLRVPGVSFSNFSRAVLVRFSNSMLLLLLLLLLLLSDPFQSSHPKAMAATLRAIPMQGCHYLTSTVQSPEQQHPSREATTGLQLILFRASAVCFQTLDFCARSQGFRSLGERAPGAQICECCVGGALKLQLRQRFVPCPRWSRQRHRHRPFNRSCQQWERRRETLARHGS